MTIHRKHLVLNNTTAITSIDSADVDDGVLISSPLADGNSDSKFASVLEEKPRFPFVTYAIASALAAVGFDGTRASATVFDALIGEGGAKASGSSHVKNYMATALTVPRSLSVSARGHAVLTMESIGYNSAGTSPLAVTQSQALPADAAAANEFFGLYAVVVNGSAVTGVTGVNIDFGIEISLEDADGGTAPKDARIIARQPRITVTTNNPALRATITNPSLAISSTTKVQLRKRAAGGTFVATASGVHVEVEALAGVIRPAGTSGDPRAFNFEIIPVHDGATGSVSIDTSATL